MSEYRPHKHLILDAFCKNPPKNERETKAFMIKIIKDIDMVVATLSPKQDWFSKLTSKIPLLRRLAAQSNPIAWYCADPDNRGLTGAAILTTSHITMHVWDKPVPAHIHFDLYSCSDYDPKDILKLLDKKYGIFNASFDVKDRQAFLNQKKPKK